MHAIPVTANIVQHFPDGHESHICALEGTLNQCVSWLKVYFSQEVNQAGQQFLYLSGALFKSHLPGWIKPSRPGELTCKLVQYFEN